VTAFAEAGIGAHQGDNGRARSKACDSAAAAKVGPGDFVLFPEEAELQTSVGAGADAIHAHEALGLAPGDAANGIVSSLAVQQASVAFVAGGRIFVQPEHGPARGETEKCAEWAYGTTPQTCDAQAHGENSKEEDAEDKALHKVSLAKVEDGEIENGVEDFASAFDPGDVALLEGKKNGTNGGVECGEQREAKGAHEQAEGIEPTESSGAEAGGDKTGEKYNVLAGLPAFVAIGVDALLATLGFRRHVADEMLQRPHGADPSAEKAAKKERGNENDEREEEAAIEGMASEGVDEGNERIELEEQPHRGVKMDVACRARYEAQRSEDQ
jgi:hypothetical protein